MSHRAHKSAASLHKQNPNQGRDGNRSGQDIKLSKALSYLLRHGAPKENVTVRPGGFIDVDEILKLKNFSSYSLTDIRNVVESNDKQRFTIRTDQVSDKIQICANQGHSFEIEDPILEPVDDPNQIPVVIHGTYLRNWNSIKKSGLRRMNRIHIHFATGEPGEEGVISGMRNSAEIYIYEDTEKAIADGIKFYRSKNNVILSPGNEEGSLSTKYFKKVVNTKTKETLNIS